MDDPVTSDEVRLDEAWLRIQDLLSKTARREAVLGREAFLEMPSTLQNELAVLQKQSEPKARTIEAVMAAEGNLREYNAKLDDALNLKQQLVGERGRRARARRREITRAVLKIGVTAAVVVGAVYLYRSQAAVKAEECRGAAACEEDGLCSGKFAFSPFGMQCAAIGDDCAEASICKVQGMCSAQQGTCMARTEDDCRGSSKCKEQGLCSPFGGTCVAGSGDDCKASRMCQERGACLEVGGRCIAPAGFENKAAASASATGAKPQPKWKGQYPPFKRPRPYPKPQPRRSP